MILMLLLTELIGLGVKLSIEQGNVKVQAPVGTLHDELREAMREQKAALSRFACFPYVETIDGLGVLSGHMQEQDITWVAPERLEAWQLTQLDPWH